MRTFAPVAPKEATAHRGQAKQKAQVASPQVSSVLERSGEPLDAATRAWMEPRFGFNFGAIRIHSDAEARRSADVLNADAYTVGRHIVLGSARPSPALMAHELTHAVQQRHAPDTFHAPIEIAPAASAEERQAHAVGRRVALGVAAGPIAPSAPGSVARLHKAEKGTYVSTEGMEDYLKAGYAFYKHWAYPNVKRVGSMEEVVSDLARGSGHIDKFRIVAHGSGGSFQIGFFKDVKTGDFAANEAGFRSAQEFRADTAHTRLLNDDVIKGEIDDLLADATAGPLLKELGVTAMLALDSPIGLFLRGVLEGHFLSVIKLKDGSVPVIPDKPVLDSLVKVRREAYRKRVIEDAPATDQKKVRKTLAALEARVPTALEGKRPFRFPQAEIDSLAAPFVEPGSAPAKLDKEIERIAREGAGGPYVKNLAKARTRIDESTHIEIRGCTVGKDPDFLEKVRLHFGDPGRLPSISAPDLYQYYFQIGDLSKKPPAGDVSTYRFDTARDQARFATDFPAVDDMWVRMERIRRYEAWPVTNEKSLEEFAIRYTFNLTMLRLLNPEYDTKQPKEGDLVWLVLRPGIPFDEKVKELAKGGKSGVIGKDWNAPPPLDPDLPGVMPPMPESFPQVPYPPVYSQTPAQADLQSRLEQGNAFVGFSGGTVVVRLDDKKRAAAFASWLVMQGYDPKRQSEAKLEKGFKKGFERALLGTHVEFLAPDYPQFSIDDVLFPSDPRYSAHIIQRP